jgi:hypothetical protein
MMPFDNNLLVELGLGSLPDAEKNKMLEHIFSTLESRVGVNLAGRMSEEQLTEFEKFIETKNEKGAMQWLETNFPDYRQVVANEFDKLKNEIKQVAPQIIASSQE